MFSRMSLYKLCYCFIKNNVSKKNVDKLNIPRHIKKDLMYDLNHKQEYKTMEDWYQITSEIIGKNYGSGLLTSRKQGYGGSPYLLLKTVYPDYDWLPWKFTYTPQL